MGTALGRGRRGEVTGACCFGAGDGFEAFLASSPCSMQMQSRKGSMTEGTTPGRDI